MRTAIAFLASIALSANATAASTQYAVDGLALGTRLNFDSGRIGNTNVVPATNLTGLRGARKREPTESDEGLIPRPIRSCTHVRETSYTSIVLKNQHFSSGLKPKTIYSDIRAALVKRHA
jgi:hypothetical protein